jgi:uncharacterized protein YjdB
VFGQIPWQATAFAVQDESSTSSDGSELLPKTNSEEAKVEQETDPEELGYMPGEIIVSYTADATAKDQASLEERLGDTDGAETSNFASGDVSLVDIADDVTVDSAIEVALNDPSVEYAFPNIVLDNYASDTESLNGETEALSASNEVNQISSLTSISTEANSLMSDDSLSENQWYLQAIKAPEAWLALQNYYESTGTTPSKTAVTILDTGMLISHPDLENVYNKANSVELVSGFTNEKWSYSLPLLRGDCYTNGGSSIDANCSHGTHVSGIIAAEAGNGGILGIASGGNGLLKNSLVDLTVVDIFTQTEVTSSGNEGVATYADLVYGLEYAKDTGAKIVNLSLGFTETNKNAQVVTVINKIINDLIEANDCLVISAAGNSASSDKCYPAALDNVLSVVSLTRSSSVVDGYTRSYFSNYGSWCDISAPGSSIYSTYEQPYTSTPTYATISGTSMACPMVTAVAALVCAANPNLSSDEIRTILCETATDITSTGLGKDEETGYGLINAEAAVNEALEQMPESKVEESQPNEPEYLIASLPVAKNCTYNGSSQVGVAGNSTVTVVGGTATNAGTYTAKVTPKDGYAWTAEGDQSTKTITWKISQLSIASSSVKATSASSSLWCTGKALKPAVTVKLGSKKLTQNSDFTITYGSNTWAGNGTITLKGKGNFTGTRTLKFTIKAKTPTVTYQAYVQKKGWQKTVSNGTLAGTTGKSLRIEGLKVKLTSQSYSGGIRIKSHVQKIGWEKAWKYNGVLTGTTNKGYRLEAVRIELTGDMAKHYDVYYRVHIQKKGWTGWAKNGASCGSAGYSYRIEGIQIKLVAKGGKAPGTTTRTFYQKKK